MPTGKTAFCRPYSNSEWILWQVKVFIDFDNVPGAFNFIEITSSLHRQYQCVFCSIEHIPLSRSDAIWFLVCTHTSHNIPVAKHHIKLDVHLFLSRRLDSIYRGTDTAPVPHIIFMFITIFIISTARHWWARLFVHIEMMTSKTTTLCELNFIWLGCRYF